ncbi:SCO family protein [Paracoccus rhizosphaerae]|uniref:SCO family protein n=1 Tax=Paracoccus rhizosphaerae TaxID=1133347 RepID=A0ABV6CK60_9RHOB|nr:SCO family protein [Paracoccus rhizosphaerae]
MRRTLIFGATALVAVGFMLSIGAWRSGDLPWQSEAVAARSVRDADVSAMTWQLVRQDGWRIGPQDWAGQTNIAFFGFTWCPDVCPLTLANISDWLEELGPDAEREDGDYTIDDNAGLFVFGPDGRLSSIVDLHDNPHFAVPKIRRAMT